MSNVATFLPFAALCVVVSIPIGRSIGGFVGKLVPVAVMARVVGSTARFEVLERFYAGVGDAKRYFGFGVMHAADIRALDFTFLIGPEHRHWWGTRFLENLSAFVITIVGDNIRSGFLAFALFSLSGATLCALAFRNAGHDEKRYAAWVLLWPSLCFWPSSMGKDAVMMLGIGLCVYGYVGVKGRMKLAHLLSGIAVLTCIRPHIATLIAFALIAAEVFRNSKAEGGWWRRLLLVGMGLAAAVIGLSQFGLEISDLEGIQEKFEQGSSRTAKGGSAFEASAGVWAIPMALVNCLMRPFPWEAHHIFALVASLEVWAFWTYVGVRRKALREALSNWRQDRILRFGLPVGLLLAFFYGLAMSNLGIIARQRVVILPFLFILVAIRRLEPAPEPTKPTLAAVRPRVVT